MVNGLTAQLMNSVMPMPAFWSLISWMVEKSIFISIGTIITQMSRPTGMFTCAYSSRPSAWKAAGNHWPRTMPATMQSTTQRLSQRSKKPIGAPAICLPATSHWALIVRTPDECARQLP